MYSSIPLQLAKWTIPTVTFAVAFFWYKRRRIERGELQWNDSGGAAESDCEEKTVSSDTMKSDMSLHDSGVREDTNQRVTQPEEPTRIPRKVSESMDIPVKNSTSQSFCNDSNQARCMDIEPAEQDVQLGSNPNASYFEIVANSQKTHPSESNSSIEKVMRIFENIVDKKEKTCEIEPFEPSYITDISYEKDKQQDEKHAEDTVKTQGQTTDERDSANHSPISGVLEGSVTDEARSEGSTDSGKGGWFFFTSELLHLFKKKNITS